MAAAMLTSSFVAKAACRPSNRLQTSNGSRVVMKAGNWCATSSNSRFVVEWSKYRWLHWKEGVPGSCICETPDLLCA